ncbi:hypothetical protein MIND_01038700 [Mycena indigotica]|uniref:Rab-GAP TBC domain-containing protein n=1 Tax=Mycena indigotica TaxID=2126181 RepID=A0A8H6VX11_9AGAR|nr:uncharacterized protein MIND_01038700 [Mycena indigotica]KAF7295006.1 hypothetical protein MIND_01038700 [Mycena indigotica]
MNSKKARRQYLNSIHNTIDRDWTPFRAVEKRFKARFPPLDLSDVLDLALVDDSSTPSSPKGCINNLAYRKLQSDVSAYTLVDRHQGLVILPGFISPALQRGLIKWTLSEHARPPNDTNLDTHYIIPEEGLWSLYQQERSGKSSEMVQPRIIGSEDEILREQPGPRQLINNTPASPETFQEISVAPKPPVAPSTTAQPALPSTLVPKLRWANIGWSYHWGSKQYDFAKGKGTIDPTLANICHRAVQAVDWSQIYSDDDGLDWGENGPEWRSWRDSYEPDAGIVNFYQLRDTLMAHVDRSEVCATSPLVSISLGHAAIFLIGDSTRDTKPDAILLRSGDVVIMSGPVCRRAYHGVPRIIEDSLPPHLVEGDDEWKEYMSTTRINVNVRQVFPKGFRFEAVRSSSFGGLSTLSSDSMVEIKRTPEPSSPTSVEDAKHRLVYTKSKVYVNPTAYARDNVPGFIAIVKREAVNPTYLLAWLPEQLVNEKGAAEWDKFTKIEESTILEEEDEDVVFIDPPTQRPESYAFSVPLTSIYSLIVHPPTLSSWYGSVGINLINGDTLPTLHFHDDESRSFTLPSPPAPKRRSAVTSYPPPPSASPPATSPHPNNSWGGDHLLARLRSYAHILRSTLQPSLFLVDPSRADIEAHSTQLFADDAVDDILAQSSFVNSHSPIPAHRRPRPLSSPGIGLSPNPYSHRSSVLHRSLASPTSNAQSSSQARTALLQSFSNITRATRHAAQNILSHPLAKPIIPHLPDPVRSLVNANGEWSSWVDKSGVGEFESARVYLARWARIVAEEGERARRREAQTLPSTSAGVAEESSSLGVFELLHSTANLPTPKASRDPQHPIDEKTWASWFGKDGRPTVSFEHAKREIFRRGIDSSATLRQRIWPFILGVLDWESTDAERTAKWEAKRQIYQTTKDEWCGVPEVFERQDIQEERHRIDVDCRRTDRNQPLFATPDSTPSHDGPEWDEKERAKRYSVISPGLSDIGAQSPTNEHIDRLAGILLTYNFYEKELGYVQGMSDMCAPIYVVMAADEELTFWCFVEFMDRMKQNFLRDQSGMKKQLLTLQQLIEVMDPELYRHLEKTDGLNLFFCFRWVLIAFKREFPFEDVLRLWEVLWTDYYSNGFVLFVALAVLESHRDVILRYLVEFDEILKYCNELSMTIELDSTLAQAEVLFLSFSQIVADIDRRHAENLQAVAPTNNLRRRGSRGGTDIALNIPPLSENLRDLLKAGRE